MITAVNLTKVFADRRIGPFKAVDGCTFTCRPGRVFGLLGPNGAGKTTTLRLLSTILVPTAGTATIGGFDLVSQPEKVRTQVGFLSGDTRLYDRLTPREILFYFGRLYGMQDEVIRVRVEALCAMLNMAEYADTRCGQLSTGMKQNVSIARSIIHDPPVMVMDEPTAGLDIMATRAIVGFIRRCKTEGKCMILSTHLMSEAEKLCDDIGIIHKGKLVACGTLAGLLEETQTVELEEAFLTVVGERA